MIRELDFLRELNLFTISLRLILAMAVGGSLGMERARKGRAAGFRTYMLVCMGAALTFLIAEYNMELLGANYSDIVASLGLKTDVSRFSAQVINGIGFLGAGTIIVTSKQQVKGLTTAAGLWASGCIGIAIGAGFYECVLFAFIAIVMSIRLITPLENKIIENSPYLNCFIEFDSLDDIGSIIAAMREAEVTVLNVDINRGHEREDSGPSASFSLKLKNKVTHAEILAGISMLECVKSIEEM